MRSRRLSSVAIIGAALVVGTGTSGLAASPAAETVHLNFRTSNGPVRVLGVIAAELLLEDLVISAGTAGLDGDTRHRLVGSTRPCSQGHISSATAFSLRMSPPGADGATVVSDKATPKLLEATAVRSVRLYTQHAGGVQLACAPAVLLAAFPLTAGADDPPWFATASYQGTVKWLTVIRVTGEDTATVSSVAVGLPSGSTNRIVATDAACGVPASGDSLVLERTVTASGSGVIGVIDQPVSLIWQALVENQVIASVRMLKGAAGYAPRGCGISFNYAKAD